MRTGNKGISLIKQFEGCELKAYPDPGTGAEPITIGYGTTVYPTGEKVMLGDTITQDQAEQYLTHDLKRFERYVDLYTEAPLTQNQFDALVSFCYNLGPTNLKSSTLLKKINSRDYSGAAVEFGKWVNAGGKRLKGLVNRREAERKLFEA